MRAIGFILCYFFAFFLKAQYNLVPNPSFENYTACPAGGGQLQNATNWINPTSWGTTDYFNSCSSVVSVPYCTVGGNCFQFARTGVGYSGLYAWGASVSNGREYAQCQLISPLLKQVCHGCYNLCVLSSQ